MMKQIYFTVAIYIFACSFSWAQSIEPANVVPLSTPDTVGMAPKMLFSRFAMQDFQTEENSKEAARSYNRLVVTVDTLRSSVASDTSTYRKQILSGDTAISQPASRTSAPAEPFDSTDVRFRILRESSGVFERWKVD